MRFYDLALVCEKQKNNNSSFKKLQYLPNHIEFFKRKLKKKKYERETKT